MKITVYLNIILFGLSGLVAAQSKAELEAQRKQAMEEITYVDNMLKTTEKERKEGGPPGAAARIRNASAAPPDR